MESERLLKSDQPPLGPSKYRTYARIGLAAEALMVAIALSWLVIEYDRGHMIIDPIGAACALYVTTVLMTQILMMEWPTFTVEVYGYMAASLTLFCAPTLCFTAVGKFTWLYRLGCWTASVSIAIVTYVRTVRGPTYTLKPRSLEGKVFVVTGSSAGIGLISAGTFLEAGATVVFANRSEEKTRGCMKSLLAELGPKGVTEKQMVFVQCDICSMTSVRAFPDSFKTTGLTKIHALALNAGAIISERKLTKDGFDMSMATNHFGHFLLVMLMLPTLLATEREEGSPPRIIQIVSATAYEHKNFDFSEAVVYNENDKEEYLKKEFEIFTHYSMCKLGSVLALQTLANKLKNMGSKIPCNAVHPGEINTDVTRDFHPIIVWLVKVFWFLTLLYLKTPRQGSLCTVFACTSPLFANSDQHTGQVLFRLEPMAPSPAWMDKKINQRMYDVSRALTNAPDVPGRL